MKANDKAIEALADVLQHHGVFHGWFPKGLPADWRQLDPIGRREFLDIAGRLADAAYAAQFKSEDYAGLIKDLRTPHGRCLDMRLDAADAIETLLAERDDFAEQLALRSESGMAKDMQEIMRINNELVDDFAEQLALRSESGMAKDMQEIMRINNELVAERDALLARLAPVEDEELVDIAAETWIEATTGMARRPSTYTISERVGARAAINAIRPHIEAAEKERCAKALEITSDEIRLHAGEMSAQEMRSVLAVLGWRAAAIRSGK